jgi:hypothetical protein
LATTEAAFDRGTELSVVVGEVAVTPVSAFDEFGVVVGQLPRATVAGGGAA